MNNNLEDDGDYHPLSGLGWSPTWHPISVLHKTSSPPPSLTTLSMATIVLQYPDLLMEISTILQPSLRKEMLAMALEQKMSSSTTLLLSTWTEPVLSLKSIFPTIHHCPELVGDMHNQVVVTARIGYQSVEEVIKLLIKKVYSVLLKNPQAVKCLDLTGFPVLRTTLEKLFQSNKFNSEENLTILLDIWIPEHGSEDSNWINLLNGSKNFCLKVQNIYCCSLEEEARNKVIASALRTNKNVKGLKLSSLDFVDWQEVERTLNIIETCSKISMLDLSRNDMFDSSPSKLVGSSLVNKTVRSLDHLSRLDLSHNCLRDCVGQVLKGLSLSYLNLTASDLSSDDLQSLLSLRTLVHLDLSQNNIGDAFSDLVLKKSKMLVKLEILELEDCSISPTNFVFLLSFIQSCPNLKILNLSYNTLEVSQIVQLIQLRLEVLLVVSTFECDCATSECSCFKKGQLTVSQSLANAGYQRKTFDKAGICQRAETDFNYIAFKAFLCPEL